MMVLDKNEMETVHAWFTVAAAVLLILGGVLYISMLVWCIRNGKGSFTGTYSFKSFFTLSFECRY